MNEWKVYMVDLAIPGANFSVIHYYRPFDIFARIIYL